jgi:nicotinic acid mononucleotide adenylyltransferase
MPSEKKNKKKTKGFKEFDPKKYINTKPNLEEAPKMGIAVVTFGRMNPITIGHEVLVNRVIEEALKRNAFAGVYLSHTQDSKKNPLSYNQKLAFAQKAFGKIIRKSSARTIIEVAQELSSKFKNLVIVVGSDRVKEFKTLLNKYNGKEYKFDTIEVVSAGERDPDADDVSGMSASKLRALAKQNNEKEFKKGLPKKLQSLSDVIIKTVRDGMDLEESFMEDDELVEAPLTRTQRIRRAMLLRRMKSRIKMGQKRARRRKAPLAVLKKRARKLAIRRMKQRLAKGTRYADMSYSQRQVIDKRLAKIPRSRLDTLAKRLLPAVKRIERDRFTKLLGPTKDVKKEDLNNRFEQFVIEKKLGKQDPDVKHLPGSQPKGYYKGVPKDEKKARFSHFVRNAKKNDDDPEAYKPAPGDAEAKTKPSKYTKKFAQQFGEACETDTMPRKRFHMLLDKNGCVVHDMRFKMYRKAREMEKQQQAIPVQEDFEDIMNQLLALEEAIQNVEQEHILESNPLASVRKKAEQTGIPYSILKTVFDRGVAAWKSGHRPGTTPTQWGLARINSFATGGKTRTTADADLWAKHKK